MSEVKQDDGVIEFAELLEGVEDAAQALADAAAMPAYTSASIRQPTRPSFEHICDFWRVAV
ncbi:hypothetical protein OIE68_24035 [Nocardia vinacea]|uniref:hypothetical protein n=1 Tax=Nocardia vinacea TaxID=96468 RepID=UPI002E117778|nr:hypothetical protein OIE68_24035 [Nocardia vinacea]